VCDDNVREGEFGSSIVTGSSPLRATVQRRHGEKASRFQACGWLVGYGPIFVVNQLARYHVSQRVATCRNMSHCTARLPCGLTWIQRHLRECAMCIGVDAHRWVTRIIVRPGGFFAKASQLVHNQPAITSPQYTGPRRKPDEHADGTLTRRPQELSPCAAETPHRTPACVRNRGSHPPQHHCGPQPTAQQSVPSLPRVPLALTIRPRHCAVRAQLSWLARASRGPAP